MESSILFGAALTVPHLSSGFGPELYPDPHLAQHAPSRFGWFYAIPGDREQQRVGAEATAKTYRDIRIRRLSLLPKGQGGRQHPRS